MTTHKPLANTISTKVLTIEIRKNAHDVDALHRRALCYGYRSPPAVGGVAWKIPWSRSINRFKRQERVSEILISKGMFAMLLCGSGNAQHRESRQRFVARGNQGHKPGKFS